MLPNYKRTNPPLWLERNRFFRKLYVLRRLLHHTRKGYHSDTDSFIRKACVKHLQSRGVTSKRGFFVDVGCCHPVKGNTTYVLYKRGWRGINIDIDEIKIEAFNLRRPQDINIACAVSEKIGELKYWRKGLWSIYNSLELKEQGFREMTVKTDTLTNLIDSTTYKDCPIDFLSVDAEGHDLAVLRSLDFDRYCPKMVCVETWDANLNDVMQSELYAFMMAKGYGLVNWISSNLMFLHGDCPDIKYTDWR